MFVSNLGKKVDDIPVKISYKIIELFSGGLYSSPNKAFEELVSNSYDANADKVSIYIPQNKLEDGAVLWVCDNGDSMDKEMLKSLWKIGQSTKTGDRINSGRLQIGKFGIGKLATYILTYKLTYICKTGDNYFAVTMDYGNIDESTEEILLDEIQLTEEEARQIIDPLIIKDGKSLVSFNLWGTGSERSWTFTLMSSLKPKVNEIKEGRLHWILSTALPLNPKFQLFYNGEELSSSKEATPILKTWIFGKDDVVVEKNAKEYSSGTYDGQPSVNLPNLNNVTGQVDLYADSLVKGKSSNWGRSHGIFLQVRGRLVNLDDALLGMPSMTHGVFNRVRIIVNANELDTFLTSTRENIKDSYPLDDLRKYIQRKFSEVRDYYFNLVEQQERENLASYKVAHASAGLTRRPLLAAVRKYFANDIGELVLTDMPNKATAEEKETIIKRLEEELVSSGGIIKEVRWIALNPEDPMAKFDLASGIANINLMHPFFANFIEEVNNPLPFQLIAVAEILTEVSLIEQGVNEDIVRDIIYRRDRILRELTFSDKQNAPVVAALLKATLSDPDGLEASLTKCFATLGFETTPLGGNGKPDGKAVAYLGFRGSEDNYSFTYDAKSTSKERIMASTAHISGVDRHRRDYQANYAVIVAIDFQGANDPDSAINKEAHHSKVTLLRANDLITLLLLAGPKQLGLKKLRELFETCHTVIETEKWINDFKAAKIERGPIKEILETAFELIKNDIERPNITALRITLKAKYPSLGNITSETITTIIQSLTTIVPNLISFENNEISLQNTPDIILSAINEVSSGSNIPNEFRQIFLDTYAAK